MEWLGYVKKSKYEKVVRERDDLRRTVAELEEKVRALEEDKKRLEKRVEFLATAVPSITAVRNIGPKTAQKLEKRGIKNLVDLIEVSPEIIAEAIDVSRERALKLIEKATNLIAKKGAHLVSGST